VTSRAGVASFLRQAGRGPQRKGQARVIPEFDGFVLIPDWRLTTAEILYHLPDNHAVLQTFVWQRLDCAPKFPELSRFLQFWHREIEGPLHSVRVASAALTRPAELRYASGRFVLH